MKVQVEIDNCLEKNPFLSVIRKKDIYNLTRIIDLRVLSFLQDFYH
ncbi:MAG: hypothetical protein ACOCP5_02250 [Halanaerobiaceae bacterium]